MLGRHGCRVLLTAWLACVAGGCTGGGDDIGAADVVTTGDRAPDAAPESDAGDTQAAPGPQVRFDPAALADDYFALPFPCDLRHGEDGSLDVARWPGFGELELGRRWLAAATELLDGYGLNSGVHLWFDADLDPATLPAAPEAARWEGGAAPSLFWMDVDPASPEQGRTFPLDWRWRAEEATYTPRRRLSVVPRLGLPRRPRTRYALVVTTAVRSDDGLALQPPTALRALWEEGEGGHPDWRAAAALLERRGLPRDEIAAMTLFTTADISARLRRVAAWGRTLPVPALKAPGLRFVEAIDGLAVLAGRHPVPVTQDGTPPYASEGGRIVFGDDDAPVIRGEQSAGFEVTIPAGTMPPGGWPLLIYLHGSSGGARQFLDRTGADQPATGHGPARVAAERGWAAVGFHLPLYGDRADPPDTNGRLLYNILGNPRAMVDNVAMAAVELSLRARLFASLSFDPAVAGAPLDPGQGGDGLVRFDGDRFVVMGQSLGSQLGVVWTTVDPLLAGAIYSGSAGTLPQILTGAEVAETEVRLLRTLLGYRPDEPLDRFDPVLDLLGHYWDLIDPVAHARHVLLEPHEGMGPRHVLQTSGLDDRFYDGLSRAALTGALGVDVVAPVRFDGLAALLTDAPGSAVPPPVQGNAADGAATAVASEIQPLPGGDGHSVAFEVPAARELWGCFLTGLAGEAPPAVPAVGDPCPSP